MFLFISQGYSIPKGTFIINSIRSVMMEEEYWNDPHVFRPERFITADGKLRREERFIPFGKGMQFRLII